MAEANKISGFTESKHKQNCIDRHLNKEEIKRNTIFFRPNDPL
jgi:hypothetical protein